MKKVIIHIFILFIYKDLFVIFFLHAYSEAETLNLVLCISSKFHNHVEKSADLLINVGERKTRAAYHRFPVLNALCFHSLQSTYYMSGTGAQSWEYGGEKDCPAPCPSRIVLLYILATNAVQLW